MHMFRTLISRRGLATATLPYSHSPLVARPKFFDRVGDGVIPTFRLIDAEGKLIEGAELPPIDKASACTLYRTMLLLPALDTLLYNVQRQGKISFYMTSHGEEATVVGSAAGLANDDEVLGQYREVGVLLWRGFSLRQVMAQCLGNAEDTSTKGRQMPVHFGSPEHHFHTISSTLATQIPQAAGVGYALRRSDRRDKNISVCYFGEGAASEGDFHAGLSLASTLPCPTLFICRNNGFAISTPSAEQYNGDGIAARGPGYGIPTIRVDGNDVLAVITAVKQARQITLETGRAVLVEAMTYRVGHHSTSDDSFAYRPRSEVESRKAVDNPLNRFRLFLQNEGWWSDEQEQAAKAELKDEVMQAFRAAEKVPRCELSQLFEDVYAGGDSAMPWHIREQKEELGKLLKKYGNSWEPWKQELSKFKGQGQELMK